MHKRTAAFFPKLDICLISDFPRFLDISRPPTCDAVCCVIFLARLPPLALSFAAYRWQMRRVKGGALRRTDMIMHNANN